MVWLELYRNYKDFFTIDLFHLNFFLLKVYIENYKLFYYRIHYKLYYYGKMSKVQFMKQFHENIDLP